MKSKTDDTGTIHMLESCNQRLPGDGCMVLSSLQRQPEGCGGSESASGIMSAKSAKSAKSADRPLSVPIVADSNDC